MQPSNNPVAGLALNQGARAPVHQDLSGRLVFPATCILVVAAILAGGSSRSDVAPRLALHPLAIMLLGFGLARLRWPMARAHAFPLSMAAALFALLVVHLIPLPPTLWQALPSRDLVVAIDQAAGLGDVWRPLSLDPAATWRALWAVSVPAALLVLGVQLDRQQRRRLLPLALLCGAASAGMAILQLLGDPQGPLYFYDVTNPGSAVGLFANRNHQALLLAMMLPMLAVFASEVRGAWSFIALLGAALLLPLVLVTGSRAGLLCAGLALASLPLLGLHEPARRAGVVPMRARWMIIAALTGAVIIVAALWLGRDLAWSRLFATTPEDELRVAMLPPLVHMITAYFPAGSGAGTFEAVYRIHEPDALLLPSYVNHAHNDWLEVLITAGAPGALLLVITALGFGRRALAAFSARTVHDGARHGRLGLLLVALAGVASISDYPLRTPALSCLFVLAVLWAHQPRPSQSSVATSAD